MRRIYLCLLVLLLITPATLQAQDSQPGIWFPNIVDEQAFSAEDGQSIAAYLINQLVGDQSAQLPEPLQQDSFPRIVFISMSDGIQEAVVVRGSGLGISAAATDVLLQARSRISMQGKPVWIKVDIVQDVFGLDVLGSQLQRFDFVTSGLYGLALSRESQVAFLPEEVSAYRIIFLEEDGYHLDLEALGDHADLTGMRWDAVNRVFAFMTLGYFYNTQDENPQILPLYRGHRMFSDVTSDEMRAAAAAGARYLAQETDENGKFSYVYYPSRDLVPSTYNLLRHAGTAYSMLEVYQVTQDEEILAAATRAIEYLVAQTVICPNAPNLRCLEEDGEIKVGGHGLGLIVLAKYTEVTGDQQYLPLMQELAAWLLSVQDENGEYFPYIMFYPNGAEAQDFISLYYPGEAMLGLLRLYAIDGDERWLDSVERGARWVIDIRDLGKADNELEHDHWFLYAINELYRFRPDPHFYEHAMRISNTIIASQHVGGDFPPDWIGGFYRPPRSTPTATRAEGLLAAYTMAHDFGTPEQASAILEASQRAIVFQLQTQFYPETVMYFENPQRVLGAFRGDLTTDEIRIDYVQHNISALLALAWVMQEQGS